MLKYDSYRMNANEQHTSLYHGKTEKSKNFLSAVMKLSGCMASPDLATEDMRSHVADLCEINEHRDHNIPSTVPT